MAPQAKSIRRWVVGVTAAIAVAWLLRAGPRHAWATLAATLEAGRRVPAAILAAAFALGVVQNVMAILRLHVLARPPGSWLDTVRRLALPQLLNAVAPARAGDLAKLAVVAEHAGVARAAGSVLVADKVADVAGGGLALLVGVAAGGPALGPRTWLGLVAALAATLALAALARLVVQRLRGTGRVARAVLALLDALAAPRRLTRATAVGAVGWLAEAAALLLLARGAGAAVSPGGSVLALLVLNVGILIPILPANAGAFEVALALALTRLGVSGPTALAVATVHHATQLISTAALALVAWSRDRDRRVRGISERDKARAIDSYDRRAPRYEALVSTGPLRWLRARERQAVLDLARLDDPAIRTVLDVGCGDGFYTRAAKRAGKTVHAVDAAPRMVEHVRDVADQALVADLDDLALDGRYDVVLCCGALEFVSHPEAAFERLCALCAPGGRVVVLVPRAGPGGLLYWIEKRLAGLSVNLYGARWLDDRATRHGLPLARVRRPLPTNQVLLFEATPSLT